MKRLIGFGVIAVAVAFAGSALAADGAATYKAKCVACHGADGGGSNMAPSLKASEFVKKSADADIAKVIKDGRAGADKKYKNFALAMPKNPMGDDDLKALAAFVKGLAK